MVFINYENELVLFTIIIELCNAVFEYVNPIFKLHDFKLYKASLMYLFGQLMSFKVLIIKLISSQVHSNNIVIFQL